MKQYRAAVIGCGRIGADGDRDKGGSSRLMSHAECYSLHPRTRLVTLCDDKADRLRRSGERWGVSRLHASIESMIEKEAVDLVSICTPVESHLGILESVLRSGKVSGVLLEKPVVSRPEEVTRLHDLMSDSSVKVSVNYVRRFPSVYRQAAEDIRKGKLGRIQHVRVLYTKGVVNNGSHAFDLLRWFFGEPRFVTGQPSTQDLSEDHTPNFRVSWDDFDASFQGLDAKAHNIFEIDILGRQGRIVLRDQGHLMDRYALEETQARHGFQQLASLPTTVPTDIRQAISYAVSDLIESIEKNRDPQCTVEDGLAALRLSWMAIDNSIPPPLRGRMKVGGK